MRKIAGENWLRVLDTVTQLHSLQWGRVRETGLFRYSLVQELLEPGPTPR